MRPPIGERERRPPMRVIDRVGGRYDVEEAEFGRVYRWCPECVVIECDCGERITLTGSVTICQCGTDHAAVVREGLADLRRPEGEAAHPWRSWRSSGDSGLPF
jgi:hypothetical protein